MRERLARRQFLTITAPGVATIVVCTAGAWGDVILFNPCDDFRITIDGPSANNLKISATIEFEET